MQDRYSLFTQFNFEAPQQTIDRMQGVAREIAAIEKNLRSLEEVSGNVKIAKGFDSFARSVIKGTKKIEGETERYAKSVAQVNKQLKPLKDEIRAIDAEFRNIEWGKLNNPRIFRKAQAEAKRYQQSLASIEQQVVGNSAAERQLVAVLKRKQDLIKGHIELQKQERIAAKSAVRIGESAVIKHIGQSTIVPFYRATKSATSSLAEFDDKVSQVEALSGATAQEMRRLRQEAKKLGSQTRFTAAQVADAESYLALSGMKTQDILRSVSGTLDLAAAGKLDLATASDIATDTMSAFGIEAKDISRVTNVMAKTAATSNTSVLQLGEAFSYSASNARLFGVSIEEASALLGIAANVGIKGSMAGTSLRSGLINLSQEKKQQKLSRDFGVEVVDDRGVARNIVDIVGDISQSLDFNFRDPQFVTDLKEIQQDIASGVIGAEDQLEILQQKYPQYASSLSGLADIFGKTAISFWSEQISSYQNLKKQALIQFAAGVDEDLLKKALGFSADADLYDNLLDQTDSYASAVSLLQKGVAELISSGKGGQGAAMAMARIMENNLAGSFRSLGSAIEAVKIAYIEPLKPLMMGIVDTLARVLRFLADLPAPVRALISGISVLTVAAAGLAAVIGTLGVALFTFAQASSVAAIASNNLAKGAAIPLTGFFQTSMQMGFNATSPIKTLYETYGKFLFDLQFAWKKTLGESIKGLQTWSVMSKTILLDLSLVARGLLFNPFAIYVGGFLLLSTLLERLVPGLNLLGIVLSVISAPLGFVFGLIKGFSSEILSFLNLSRNRAFRSFAPLFETIKIAIAQATRSFERFAESGERLGRSVASFLIQPFIAASEAIARIWQQTLDAIYRPLQPFAEYVQRIGQLLVSFLAENSPGPTFQIRALWGFTIDWLRVKIGYFVDWVGSVAKKVKYQIDLVYQALFGFPEEVRTAAREEIFLGLLNGINAVSEAIASLIVRIRESPDTIDELIKGFLSNLDFFSFAALVGSSLPMTLLAQLEPAAEQIVKELSLVLSSGIPRALIYALPSAVAYAISTGMILGVEDGIGRFLDRLPKMIHSAIESFQDFLTPELKRATNVSISSALSSISIALGNGAVAFDVDLTLSGIDKFASSALESIIEYLHQVGEVSKNVGQRIAEVLAPLLEVRLLPFLPPMLTTFTTIIPLLKSFGELLRSPSVAGLATFFINTLIPAAISSLNAAVTSVVYFSRLLLNAPILLLGEILEQFFGVLTFASKAVSSVRQIFAIEEIVAFLQRLITVEVPKFLATIPVIGQSLSAVFVNTAEILGRFLPKLAAMMIRFFPTEAFARLINSYGKIFVEIGKGIAYGFEQGLIPVTSILLKLINPFSVLRFLKLYFRTSSFKGIVKRGLFAVNPLDLLFGAGWMQVVVAGLKIFSGVAFPTNIVSTKMSKALQLLANPADRAMAVKNSRAAGVDLLVSRFKIYEKATPSVKVLIRLLEGLMIINPLVQSIGSLTMALTLWYTILKPINQEMLDAISRTRLLGVSLQPLAIALLGIRFLVVDLGEVLGNSLLATPGVFLKVMRVFDRIGNVLDRFIFAVAEISRILFNLSKNLAFDPLFAAIAIPFTLAFRFILIEFRNLLIFIKNETQAYGDAIAALAHGNIVPLLRQLFYDTVMRPLHLIGELLDLTVVNIIRGIALVGKAVVATGIEILRFIANPIAEIKRGVSFLKQELSAIALIVEPYSQQLVAIGSFINRYKIQILAISYLTTRILGLLSGFEIIADIIAAVSFLISEYRSGFQVLGSLINFLAHPIEGLRLALIGIGELLDFSLPPEFSSLVAGIANAFVSMLPIILGVIFTIGLMMRKSIGGAFSYVIESGTSLVRVILSAVDSLKDLLFLTKRFLVERTPLALFAAKGLHSVRSQAKFGTVANPIAYSQNPHQQNQATAIGANLKMARELHLYQRRFAKIMKDSHRYNLKELIHQAKHGTQEEKDNVLGNVGFDPNTGKTYKVMPILEKTVDRFGRQTYRLTKRGIEEQRRMFTETLKQGDIQERISRATGLDRAYKKATGYSLSPEILNSITAAAVKRNYGSGNKSNINGRILSEVNQGLLTLNQPPNPEQIKAKFLYVDVLKVANQKDPFQTLNLQGLQKLLNSISEGSLGQSGDILAEYVKEFKSVLPFDSEIQRLRTMPAKDQSRYLSEVVFEPRTRDIIDTFDGMEIGYSGDQLPTLAAFKKDPRYAKHFNRSGETPQGLYEAFKATGDDKAVVRFENDLKQFLIERYLKSLKSIARHERIDIDPLIESVRRQQSNYSEIVTAPGAVLRQGLQNLSGSVEAASGTLEGAKNRAVARIAKGFLRFTGIDDLVNVIQQNMRLVTEVRKLEKEANYEKFTRSRYEALGRERREGSLKSLLSSRNLQDSSELFDEKRLLNIFDNYIKTGKTRYSFTPKDFKSQVSHLGESFAEGRTEQVRRNFQQNLTQQQLQLMRQFILKGVDTEEGIKGNQLRSIAEKLRTSLKLKGKDTQDVMQALNQLRGKLIDRDLSHGLSDFASLIVSPNESIRATQEELDKINARLGIKNLGELRKYLSRGTIFKRFGNSVKEYFRSLEVKVEGYDFLIRQQAKDLRAYAEIVGMEKAFDRLGNLIDPLYKRIATGLTSNIQRIYNNAELIADSISQKFANLATVKSLGSVYNALSGQTPSLLNSGKALGGRNYRSFRSFSDAMVENLGRNDIERFSDRNTISAAMLRARAEGKSIEDELRRLNYGDNLTQVTQALAQTLKINTAQAEELLKNPRVTSRLGLPIQFLFLKELPKIIRGISQDLGTLFSKTLGRAAAATTKEILSVLPTKITKDVGRIIYRFGDSIAIALSSSGNLLTKIVGENALSKLVSKVATKLSNKTISLTQKIFAAGDADFGETKLSKIRDAASWIFTVVANRLKNTADRIEAQGGFWSIVKRSFLRIKQMLGLAPKPETVGSKVYRYRQELTGLKEKQSGFAQRFDASNYLKVQQEIDLKTAQLKTVQKELKDSNSKNVFSRLLRRVNSNVDTAQIRGRTNLERISEQGLPYRVATDRKNELRLGGTKQQREFLRGNEFPIPVTYSEFKIPVYRRAISAVLEFGKKASMEMAVNFSASAFRSGNAWGFTRTKVTKYLGAMVAKAKRTGIGLIRALNCHPSDRVQGAWQQTERSVRSNLNQMATNAENTGARMAASGTEAAITTQTAMGKAQRTIASFWKTGLAAGSSLAALGGVSQTVGYSLSNLGVIDADSEMMHTLVKVGEISTIIGSIGSVAAPLLSLAVGLAQSLTLALGGIGPLVTGIGVAIANFAGVSAVGFMPIALGIGAIATSLFLVYKITGPLLKLITKIADFILPILDPITSAIGNAWSGLVGNIKKGLGSLVDSAKDAGSRLISALNCHPTIRVKEAWDGTVERVKGALLGLLNFARGIGSALVGSLKGTKNLLGKTFGKFFSFGQNDSQKPVSQNNIFKGTQQKGEQFVSSSEKVFLAISEKIVALAQRILSPVVFMIENLSDRLSALDSSVSYQSTVLERQLRIDQINLTKNIYSALTNKQQNRNLYEKAMEVEKIRAIRDRIRESSFAQRLGASGKLEKVREIGKFSGGMMGLSGGNIFAALMGLTSISGMLGFLVYAFDSDFLKIRTKTLDLVDSIVNAFKSAIVRVKKAWNDFSQWFANLPLVGTAIDIGRGLISALNCHPTIRVKEAWDGTVSFIQNSLKQLWNFAKKVGNFLSFGFFGSQRQDTLESLGTPSRKNEASNSAKPQATSNYISKPLSLLRTSFTKDSSSFFDENRSRSIKSLLPEFTLISNGIDKSKTSQTILLGLANVETAILSSTSSMETLIAKEIVATWSEFEKLKDSLTKKLSELIAALGSKLDEMRSSFDSSATLMVENFRTAQSNIIWQDSTIISSKLDKLIELSSPSEEPKPTFYEKLKEKVYPTREKGKPLGAKIADTFIERGKVYEQKFVLSLIDLFSRNLLSLGFLPKIVIHLGKIVGNLFSGLSGLILILQGHFVDGFRKIGGSMFNILRNLVFALLVEPLRGLVGLFSTLLTLLTLLITGLRILWSLLSGIVALVKAVASFLGESLVYLGKKIIELAGFFGGAIVSAIGWIGKKSSALFGTFGSNSTITRDFESGLTTIGSSHIAADLMSSPVIEAERLSVASQAPLMNDQEKIQALKSLPLKEKEPIFNPAITSFFAEAKNLVLEKSKRNVSLSQDAPLPVQSNLSWARSHSVSKGFFDHEDFDRYSQKATQQFEFVSSWIENTWDNTVESVWNSIGNLLSKTGGAGKQLQGDLSEASPGPTYWIRKNWGKTIDYLSGGINALALQTSAYGATALLAFSPAIAAVGVFLMSLGATAFVAAVILANFLGLRSILRGIFNLTLGGGKVTWGILKGTAIIVSSLAKILLGLFFSLRGDMSLIEAGLKSLRSGFLTIKNAAIAGMIDIRAGLNFIWLGLKVGLSQVLGVSIVELESRLSGLWLVLKNGVFVGDKVAEMLIFAFVLIKNKIGSLATSIKNTVISTTATLRGAIKRSLANSFSFKEVKTSFRQQLNSLFSSLSIKDFGWEKLLSDGRKLWTRTLSLLPRPVIGIVNYIKGFIYGFVSRLKKELPPQLIEAFDFAPVKVKLNWLKAKINNTVSWLREKFNNWLPEDTSKRVVQLFKGTLAAIRAAVAKTVNWLKEAPLIPQGFELLGTAVNWAISFIEKLQEKLFLLQMSFQLDTSGLEKFSSVVIGIIRLIVKSFGKMSQQTETRLNGLESSLTNFIANTPIFQWVLVGIEKVLRGFSWLIDRVKSGWSPFINWISSTDIFDRSFAQLGSWGKKLRSYGNNIVEWWKKLPSLLSLDFLKSIIPNAISLIEKLQEKVFLMQMALQLDPAALERFTSSIVVGIKRVLKFLGLLSQNTEMKLNSIGAALRNFVATTPIFQWILAGAEAIVRAMGSAIERIQDAWKNFSDRFKVILTPISRIAEFIANKLISSLNCHASERTTDAWEKAAEKIAAWIKGLLTPAKKTASAIIKIFGNSLKIVEKTIVFCFGSIEGGVTVAKKIIYALLKVFTKALKLFVLGAKSTAKVIRAIVKFSFGFLKGFLEGMLPSLHLLKGAIAATIEKTVLFSRDFRRALSLTGDARMKVKGFTGALVRLYDALLSLKDAFKRAVGSALSLNLQLRTIGFSGEEIGRVLAQATLLVLKGGLKITSVIFKIINLFAQFGVEVVTLGVKVTLTTRHIVKAVIPVAKMLGQLLIQILKIIPKVGSVSFKTIIVLTNLAKKTINFFVSLYDKVKKMVLGIEAFSLSLIKAFSPGTYEFIVRIKDSLKRASVDGVESLNNGLQRLKKLCLFLLKLPFDLLMLPLRLVRKIAKGVADIGKNIFESFYQIEELTGILDRIKEIFAEVKTACVQSFGEIKQAITETFQNLGKILNNAVPGLENIIKTLKSPAKAVGSIWQKMTGGISDSVETVVNESEAQGEQIVSNLSENSPGPTWQIRQHWDTTGSFIKDKISGLGVFAQKIGKMMLSGLSENSPGPTRMIRDHWAVTAAAVKDDITQIETTAQAAGRSIRDSLSGENMRTRLLMSPQELGQSVKLLPPPNSAQGFLPPASNKLHQEIPFVQTRKMLPGKDSSTPNWVFANTPSVQEEEVPFVQTRRMETEESVYTQVKSQANVEEVDQKTNALKEQSEALREAGSAANSALLSVGSALSNFAPQLATPLFMMNDFVDAYSSLSDAIPKVILGLRLQGATSVQTSGSNLLLAGSATTASGATVTGTAAAAAATTANGSIILGMQVLLAKGWTAVTIAVTKTAAVTKVVMKFLYLKIKTLIAKSVVLLVKNPWILAIALAMTAIYLIVKHNLFNIQGIIENLIKAFKTLFLPLVLSFRFVIVLVSTLIRGVINEVQTIVHILGKTVGDAFHSISKAIASLFVPLYEFLQLFFGRGGVTDVAGVAQGVANIILMVLKPITWAVSVLSKAISWIFNLLTPIALFMGEVALSVIGLSSLIVLLLKGGAIAGTIASGLLSLVSTLGVIGGFLGWLILPLLMPIWTFIVSVGTVFLPAIGAIGAALVVVGKVLVLIGSILGFLTAAFGIGPVITGILAIIAAGWLLKQVFVLVIGVITGAFKGVWLIVSQVFGALFTELRTIGSLLGETFGLLFEPFRILFASTGKAKGEFQPLMSLVKGVMRLMLKTASAIAFVLVGIIKLVSFLIQILVTRLATGIQVVMTPIVGIARLISWIIEGITSIVGAVALGIGDAVRGMVTSLIALKDVIASALSPFAWLFKAAGRFLGMGAAEDSSTMEPVKRSRGGLVTGGGTSTSDSIPAMLSDREFVVKASSVRGNLGSLEYLNRYGNLPTTTAAAEALVGTPLIEAAVPTLAPAPVIPAGVGGLATAPAASQAQNLGTISINLNLEGDIILNGADSSSAASEFIEKIDPYLEQAVLRIIQRRLENNF